MWLCTDNYETWFETWISGKALSKMPALDPFPGFPYSFLHLAFELLRLAPKLLGLVTSHLRDLLANFASDFLSLSLKL